MYQQRYVDVHGMSVSQSCLCSAIPTLHFKFPKFLPSALGLFFPRRKESGHEASCTTRLYCKTWPCVRGSENRPCSEAPETPPLLYFVLYSSTRSAIARLEAMREAEFNRRARIIIDLILYISASFNHTMHLLCVALIYTECIPSLFTCY